MRRRRGTLSEEDRAIWASYARLVAPLPGHALADEPAAPAPAPEPPPAAPPPALRPAPPAAPPGRALPAALWVGLQPPGLDKASWERFRSGKLAPARTLDLHGHTAQRAFFTLTDFLHRAHGDRLRVVEVITGRGPEGAGVLRRELPLWLNLPGLRPLVLGAVHPSATNVGSVRLLLRRPRDERRGGQ